MICIGKECRYNKNNMGEYCGLKNACFDKRGEDCILQERIDELELEKREIEDALKDMYATKIKILAAMSD